MLTATVLGISGWALWLNASAGQGNGVALQADLLAVQAPPVVVQDVQIPERKAPAAASQRDYPQWQDISRQQTEIPPGEQISPAMHTRRVEDNAQMLRVQQALLRRRKEILQMQLLALEAERRERDGILSEQEEEDFRRAATRLMELVQDERQADEFIKQALLAVWDARAEVLDQLAPSTEGMEIPNFIFPVPKKLGISAYFHDPDYAETFEGLVHSGIDFKARKGTPVVAVADGIVEKVVDNGYGINYITVRHGEHFFTFYGHLDRMISIEGQAVQQGDIIGYSNGRPGDRGAGFSTGEHLHFEMRIDGIAVDPLKYMPPL